MSVLVLAEHDNVKVNLSTQSVVTAARVLKLPISILVAGYRCQAVAQDLIRIKVIDNILLVDLECYQHFLAESIAPLLAHYANKFNYFLAPATTFGKNILPRLAGKLNVEQISDIIAILDRKTYQRPIYAGNAIAVVSSQYPIQVFTVRPTVFSPPCELGKKSAPIEKVEFASRNDLSIFINEEDHAKDRPESASEKIVIFGKRALKHKENFERLVKIADRLGGAVGASRAVVDAGLAPNEFSSQSNGTSRSAHALFRCRHISGAIQNLAGMI
ncbi:electron transfer flavoprotein subunit alpha/FixB family protein [Candidatus Coxiella mudrowiae]|uniref:electron transfer flavoprotein subunit alpha/FixB family protein n=1 Tax=Candidatus Coxiella mudrowiae TaxID=2054173 RepID=UPI003144FE19